MQIGILDIETAPALFAKYRMWDEGAVEEIQEAFVLSFAFQWYGKKTEVFALPDFKNYRKNKLNDKELIKLLREYLDKADVVIGWNSNKFDIRWFNTQCIKHHLKPPSPYKKIDLMQFSKNKFYYQSNRLNYVAKYIGLGEKLETGGKKLWFKCMGGDLNAWKKMKRYNRRDVDLTAEIYKDYLPWIQQKQPIWDRPTCRRCNNPTLVKRGFEVLTTGKFQKYKCSTCGAITKGAKVIQNI